MAIIGKKNIVFEKGGGFFGAISYTRVDIHNMDGPMIFMYYVPPFDSVTYYMGLRRSTFFAVTVPYPRS